MIVRAAVDYPESDGEPIADNSLQFDEISRLKWGLAELFAGQDVAVHGDLLWYAIADTDADDRERRQAPDVLLAFGRPARDRSSYRQWEEDGVAPQVVFEVMSGSNTHEELQRKREWYARHGVEEYYEIEPELKSARAWARQGDELVAIPLPFGWRSPRMGVTFEQRRGSLTLRRPDGRELEPVLERFRKGLLAELEAKEQRARAEAAERQLGEVTAERDAAKDERDAVTTERDDLARRMDAMRARMLALGIDPDADP